MEGGKDLRARRKNELGKGGGREGLERFFLKVQSLV